MQLKGWRESLTSRGEQGARLDGHLKLGSAQDEELAPALLEQDKLVAEGQSLEGGHMLGPLDTHEEEASGCLADGLRVGHVGQAHVVRVLL